MDFITVGNTRINTCWIVAAQIMSGKMVGCVDVTITTADGKVYSASMPESCRTVNWIKSNTQGDRC